jgi:hypothetical protein
MRGKCAACGCFGNVHKHHVFFGKNRHISDKYGFIVNLCQDCHTGTDGVHGKNGKELDLQLKRMSQAKFERTHTRKDFIALIGRSYL